MTSDHFEIEDDLLTVVGDDNYSTNAWLDHVISKGIHKWRLKIEAIHEQIHDYFDFVIGVTTLTTGHKWKRSWEGMRFSVRELQSCYLYVQCWWSQHHHVSTSSCPNIMM